jgi:DNA repair protein RecN (Recombination protein N)
MMLQELRLSGIATFNHQELQVPSGMVVLAGEPGAGKSLLIEAIDWAFGAPVAARDVLRHGCDRGRVGLTFRLSPQHDAQFWALLHAEDIELEDGSVTTGSDVMLDITREFTEAGSRFRVNGSSVSRKFMQEIRPFLLEMQSQHGTVALLQPAQQHALADAFGGDPLAQQLAAVERVYRQWAEAQRTLEAYQNQQEDAEKRLHLLRLEVQELDTLNITEADEDTQLETELARLAHAEQLKQAYAESQQVLLGADHGEAEQLNLLDGLSLIRKRLAHVERAEGRVTPLLEQLESLREQLRDVSQQLDALDGDVDLNPHRMDEIQVRLNELQKMKRLYGPTLQDVMHHHEQASEELAELEFRNNNPEALKQQAETLHHTLVSVCLLLSETRRHIAETLETRVNETLKALAMPHAQLKVALLPCAPGAKGQEQIEFQFSANPGEPLRPLGKVASGGELSRVLLALCVASLPEGKTQAGKLYAFDEIDTGTSGEAAKTIGQQLQRLAEAGHHVLTITHQPIVAAAAHHHIWVSKDVRGGATTSQATVYQQERDVEALLMHLASGVQTASTDDEMSPQARAFVQGLRRNMKPLATV